MRLLKSDVKDKQNKDGTLLIRFYYYSDPYKGYGDGGTNFFAKINVKNDLEQDAWENWLKLTDKKIEEFEKLAKSKDLFIDNGIKAINNSQYQSEVNSLKRELERISKIH